MPRLSLDGLEAMVKEQAGWLLELELRLKAVEDREETWREREGVANERELGEMVEAQRREFAK